MSTKLWSSMNDEEKQQYNSDENEYNNYNNNLTNNKINMQGDEIPSKSPNDNDNVNNNDNNKKDKRSKIQKINDFNKNNASTFDENKETSVLMLKENQIIFLVDNDFAKFDQVENFNTVLSTKNQFAKNDEFKKTDNPKLVDQIFTTIFADDKARVSLKYLCAYAVGGKFKKDRKGMNDNIIDLLQLKKLFPYGKDKKCGYNGLLKLAPRLLSSLREKTLPEKQHPYDMNIKAQINYYAPGYESNFEFNSLKIIGCNQAALNFCYTKLLLSIDVLTKKEKPGDDDIKLLKRLATFISGYTVSDYITNKDSTKRVLALISNMDLKGSDITFDSFGYL